MSATRDSWFVRHRALTVLIINGSVFATIALAAEVALRLFIPYNPGFYTSVKATDTELTHPYGMIKINSDGFPDGEFDLSKSRRIGYFGDSVTYGVGAGYGYRISEYLEEAHPEYEHLNLGGIGLAVSTNEIEYSARLAKKFGLTDAIYLFNLNDILPNEALSGDVRPVTLRIRDTIVSYFDWMRGRSYLYTYLRTYSKNLVSRYGIGFHGYAAYELYPEANETVLRETAERINLFHQRMTEIDVRLSVVILPYEMQISEEAELAYREHGIRWEHGFIDRGAQKVVLSYLNPELRVVDAYYAFVGNHASGNGSRATNRLGQYFVYDKGDTLDWNHPNRFGHRLIAEYLASVRIFDREAEADQSHTAISE